MQLIITGATGTAGSEVLRQALLDARVTAVTVLTRRPLPPHVAPSSPSPKLRVLLHDDFASYPASLLSQLKGYDACIWALGKSSLGMKEADYERLTVDYAVEAAKAFAGLKAAGGEGAGNSEKKGGFVFAFVSGEGTDQREGKASQMFGRVKGKAERTLASLPTTGFPSLAPFSFRPGGILPVQPVPEAPWFYRFPFSAVLSGLNVVAPSHMIKTDVLARGMIEACLKGSSGRIEGWPGKGESGNEGVFANQEIKRLAEGKAAS
ncbi:hypothetical protein JCM6882_009155 [Rhodosporidiobolus microsporus]